MTPHKTKITFGFACLSLLLVYSSTLLASQNAPGSPKDEGWQQLFDAKTLGAWQPTSFGGEGRVLVENGQIILEMGGDLTGITWSGGPLPKMDYEISLEAIKLDGNDFFCGLTFPVGDSYCSFIVGGWAGVVVGLSSIDGRDASENETTRLMQFPKDRWYRIRVRVTQAKIEAWIDQEKVVDVATAGHRLSVRGEVEPSKPLGIASWRTKAALRDLKMQRLQPEQAK